MGHFVRDIRYSFSVLTKKPGFTAAALITLALGIGINSTIFSVINSVLLQPLPFPQPERIVRLSENRPTREGRSFEGFSLNHFREWRDNNQVFASMAAYQNQSFTLTNWQEPVQITGYSVSADFFRVLGANPQHGRIFDRSEEAEGNHRVIVLSHTSWQKYLEGTANPVESILTLDGVGYTVVGVMPSDFYFPDRETEFWVPLTLGPRPQENVRRVIVVPAIARLKAEVNLAQAEEEGSAIVRQLRQQAPDFDPESEGGRVILTTLQDQMVAPVRPALLVLLAAVGFVLLIACANVANLMLARSIERRREIAIRSAIGAARARLVQQLITESTVLAFLGGILGLLLAHWMIRLIPVFGAIDIPRINLVSIDWRVLFYTLIISLATGLLFGLAPATQAWKTDIIGSLKEGERGRLFSLRGSGHGRLRGILAAAEIALALVLLISAALLINSFVRLIQIDSGYNPDHVLTAQLKLPQARYPSVENSSAFYRQLLDEVRQLPEVGHAGVASLLPLTQARMRLGVQIEGRPQPSSPEEATVADFRVVSSGYFQALGIEKLEGRVFTDNDNANSLPVVIINDAFVRQHFPGDRPIGQKTQLGEIIGVVADVRAESLDAETRPIIYTSFLQAPSFLGRLLSQMHLVVRTTTQPQQMIAVIRSRLAVIDPQMPIFNIAMMEDRLADSVARPRFFASILGLFAAIAVVLAAVGIYGVISYSVSQSIRETGIRMALGADRRQIVHFILAQGFWLTIIGIIGGLAAAYATTRLLSSLLFGIEATDITTFVLFSLLLAAVSFLACYIPARRAARLNPMHALRYE